MNNYRDKIKELALRQPPMSNAQIAAALGCSKRTVRRHAGPFETRLREYFGIDVDIKREDSANILLLDIETAPMEVFVWSLRQHGWIAPRNIIKNWSILCWSAKWLFDDQMFSAVVRPEEAIQRKDDSVLQSLWNLVDQADIIIAHNGAKFDIKRINARFAVAGYNPPMPFRVIDTLRIVKKQFDLPAYNLDFINGMFGLQMKESPGFDTWIKCVNGDMAALQKLNVYCQRDTRILEETYVKIRPWIKGHPNVGLYIDSDSEKCTNCGNEDIEWRGFYYTPAGRFRAFRCNNCGAVGRSRFSDLTKEERKALCVSVAA